MTRDAGRRPLFIGNWKMQLTQSEAVACAQEILATLPAALATDREVALAPSFTALPAVGALLRGGPVRLAAQDLFWEDEGAFTGEISPSNLQELGVTYVLAGHSERRRHLGETDLMVNHKVRAALRSDLRPVVCVGEQEAARASGRAESVVRTQLLRALEEVGRGHARQLVIAYEPVWAIGTGRAATPADASQMHAVIRSELARLFGEAGTATRILYGGSVGESNIDALMGSPGIDGVLVGGASLKAPEFARIVGFLRPGA
ncbi:MAG TPA: triose-phosphate isomerase [Candidatus Polarisedimenticolia bacterium]|nr:triose-phosphate isomerase [Candidatus Polarisedimenticolia bacterium]